MTFRSRPAWPLLLLSAGLAAYLAMAPVVAAATSDTLTWNLVRPALPVDIPATESSDYVPVAGAFNAVSFADAYRGWAVGVKITAPTQQGGGTRASFIASTTDGGASWTASTVASITTQINAVVARGPLDVWVAGDSGVIAHWDGTAWTRRAVDGWSSTKAFRAIAFSGDKGWAVGDDGGIAVTTNGGSHWARITTDATLADYRGLAVVDPSHVIAVGDGGLLSYVDSTKGYSRSSGTAANLHAIAFADDRHGWVVGNDTTFLSTSDGGITWISREDVPLPEGYQRTELDLRTVSFADPMNGMAAGTYMSVWRTTDGGRTWWPDRIDDGSGFSDIELRGVTFRGGSADHPVTVGRAFNLQLYSGDHKARIHLGTWEDRDSSDVYAPATASDAKAAYIDSATVTLTADDGFGGAGVAHTYYVLDGGQPVEGTVISVTTPGQHTVEYWSEDAAVPPNVESPRNMRSFTVSTLPSPDTTPPVTTAQVATTPGTASVSLTATDGSGGSGVAQTFYRLDGAVVVTGTAPVTTIVVHGAGSHTLWYWSVDAAGVTETAQQLSITVPKPEDTAAPQVSTDAKSTYTGSAVFTITGMDEAEGSGVARIEYRYNNESKVYTVAGPIARITTYREGTQTLRYAVVDNGGNRTSGSVTFTITPLVTGPYTSTSSPRRGRTFTIYGYVYPRHTSGTYLATVQLYRYRNGAYVPYRSVSARRYSVTGSTVKSKYAVLVSLPYAGKWRIRAYHRGTGHPTGYSAYKYVTVK